MKRIIISICLILFFVSINAVSADDAALSSMLKRLTYEKIVPLTKESIIFNAVKEANKEATKSLDEIIRLDKKWQAIKGIDEWMGGFLNNPCANYLRKIQNDAVKGERSLYAEIFVMDKQGNLVAATNKTSDYWQGDEDKFIKSFADGNGAVFIDEPVFDESSGRYVVQVSAPILDPGTKKAVGAITAALDLDAIAEQFLY